MHPVTRVVASPPCAYFTDLQLSAWRSRNILLAVIQTRCGVFVCMHLFLEAKHECLLVPEGSTRSYSVYFIVVNHTCYCESTRVAHVVASLVRV